jgi:hypothetical protein
MTKDFAPPPREYRLRLTPEIDAALEAHFQAFGREAQEVVIEVLGEWARQKRKEAEFLLEALARAEGRKRDDAA